MRQIIDYSQSGREAAFALAGALGTLPSVPPPPEQLPEPPAAPLSYLSDLVEQVGQPEPLTQQQQHQILFQLEPALRSADAEERRGGRYVLQMFSKRGDLYADVDRTLSQTVLLDDEPEQHTAPRVAVDVLQRRSSTPPDEPAEVRRNLLADPQWADALSAFFAQRWAEAVERFESLQASYPGEGRVETRLTEARLRRDIDVWSSRAETSAAAGDWDEAVSALENLANLDPAHPDVGARLERARMAQRRKALVDEMTVLHQAGQWNGVVAAGRELARIDPGNPDPDGMVSDAQAKLGEDELANRYAQALNHLDDEQWQPAADLLAAIEQQQPGYRDAGALLNTARQHLGDTAERAQRATAPIAVPSGRTTARKTRRWMVPAAVAAVILVAGLIIVMRGSDSSDTSTATSGTPDTTTPLATPIAPEPQGPNKTIADYIKDNGVEATGIAPGTPDTPTINLPVPEGWTRIPEGADAPYFGIVFDKPTNPADPPEITASVERLRGNVDTDQLLAAAPGGVRNLPGFAGADCVKSALSGQPACQIGGTYTEGGVTRVVAQKTVVIQREDRDGIYVLRINAGGLKEDMEALNVAADAIDARTTISP